MEPFLVGESQLTWAVRKLHEKLETKWGKKIPIVVLGRGVVSYFHKKGAQNLLDVRNYAEKLQKNLEEIVHTI